MMRRREFLAGMAAVGGAVGLFDGVRRRVAARQAASAGQRTMPLDIATAQQARVVSDPARFKVLLVGRRGGKTICAVLHAADAMLRGPSKLVFLAKTIGSAREIMWEPFKQLNREHGWGFVFDHGKNIITHPATGARMLVRGIDDRDQLEKLRGPSFDHVYIDECGTHKPLLLQYLVDEVLDATLMDRAGSTLWMLGTPTVQAYGYFYKASTGYDDGTGAIEGYERYTWTARDNPHVNYQQHVFDPRTGVLKRKGWTTDSPAFRREYLAEWVVDSDRRVFRFDRARNVIPALPELRYGDSWRKILVLDFGVNDATACTRMQGPKLYGRAVYITRAWSRRGLAPSQAADLIAREIADFAPDIVIGDSGGLGKGFIEEYHLRYPLLMPVQPAEKTEKRASLEWCSDALGAACLNTPAMGASDIGKHVGLFVVDGETGEIQRQFASLLWDDEREDIAEGQNDDEAMTGVYGYRRFRSFLNKQRPDIPPENLPPSLAWRAREPQLSEGQRAFLDSWNQGTDE